MLESIYVGMTGLLGYSRGLRVIANNTANINTPGFKSSSLQFADLFYSGGNLSGGYTSQNNDQVGFGLNTIGTAISFKPGELRQTGNDLDVAVDGQGMFILKNDEGKVTYTRAGQFKFDENGVLVNRVNGEKVMGMGGNGELTEITLAGQMLNPGKPTTSVQFSGLLQDPGGNPPVSWIVPNAGGAASVLQVVDASGVSHALGMKVTRLGAASGGTGSAVRIDLTEGGSVVGSGLVNFVGNVPTPETALVSVTYTPAGQSPMALTLDLSKDVRLLASSSTNPTTASFKMDNQNGAVPGTLSGTVFDKTGTLRLSYSNGETVKGMRLALGRFDSPDAVGALGNNQFEALNKDAWHFGGAGDGAFGAIAPGRVEISNVDLSQEFSDLVIMQRGYQASSQVISTANDMLQELFSMKSK